MEKEKEVLLTKELKEVKGGTDPDRVYCPDLNTCPYASSVCYYQNFPGGYMLLCILA